MKHIHIGIIGTGETLRQAAFAWKAVPGAVIAAMASTGDDDLPALRYDLNMGYDIALEDDPVKVPGLDGVDGVELAYCDAEKTNHSRLALGNGKHLLLHKPVAGDTDRAQSLADAVANTGITCQIIDPVLQHPFIAMARKAMDDDLLGELQHIRVKSCLGAHGEHLVMAGDHFLRSEPFDKIALMELLMGPIAQVHCYGRPGNCMVSLKFAAAARYGVHEAVHAPDLPVGDGQPPVDEVIEITGMDGVLFLRNLRAEMVVAPKFSLKRKDTVTVKDDATAYAPDALATLARQRFARGIRKPRHGGNDLALALRAAKVNAAIALSLKESRPVTV